LPLSGVEDGVEVEVLDAALEDVLDAVPVAVALVVEEEAMGDGPFLSP
jgi:hypothetical protein